MNIFILSNSPALSAFFQHDRHVVKMIVESCQLLSTACQESGVVRAALELDPDKCPPLNSIYKVTHPNHPSNIWARSSIANFTWLAIHLHYLLAEYHHRFPGRTHKCESMKYTFGALAARMSGLPHPTKPHRGSLGFYTDDSDGNIIINPTLVEWALANHTPFVYCGPDEHKTPDVIESYHRYYIAEKCPGNRWTQPSRSLPNWLAPHAHIHTRPTQLTRKPRQPRERKPFVIPPPHTQRPAVASFLSRLASRQ